MDEEQNNEQPKGLRADNLQLVSMVPPDEVSEACQLAGPAAPPEFQNNTLDSPILLEEKPNAPYKMTMEQYERLICDAEGTIQALLSGENNNRIEDLVWSFAEFILWNKKFPNAFPVVEQNESACVGNADKLVSRWHKLDARHPGFADSSFIASYEKVVKIFDKFLFDGPSRASIEEMKQTNLLVCVPVCIDGRPGVIVAEPDTHNKCITVMKDEEYPHSGAQLVETSPDVYTEVNFKYSLEKMNHIEYNELNHKSKGKMGIIHLPPILT